MSHEWIVVLRELVEKFVSHIANPYRYHLYRDYP